MKNTLKTLALILIIAMTVQIAPVVLFAETENEQPPNLVAPHEQLLTPDNSEDNAPSIEGDDIISLERNIPIIAQNAPTETASGTCGDNLKWVLTSDGTLTISGTGTMTAWESSFDTPWYLHVDSIITVIITHGVKNIGAYAFAECFGLTSVILSKSVTSIDDYAFFDCDGLTSIIIPEGVISIDDYAFFECTELTDVTISKDVTNIGVEAFSFCSNLTSAYFYGNAPTVENSSFSDTADSFTIYYLADKSGWTTPTWNGYNTTVFTAPEASSPFTVALSGPESALPGSSVIYKATISAVNEASGVLSADFAINYPAGLTYVSSTLSAKPSDSWIMNMNNNATSGKLNVVVAEEASVIPFTPATNTAKLEIEITFTVDAEALGTLSLSSSDISGTSGTYEYIEGTGSTLSTEIVTIITVTDESEYVIDDTDDIVNLNTEKSTLEDIKANFNEPVVIYDKNGNEITEEYTGYIGTGCVIKLIVEGEVVDSLTVIIEGDIDGSGDINANDYANVKGAILEIEGASLEGIYMTVADVNGNGKIESNDYFLLRLHVLGIIDLYA